MVVLIFHFENCFLDNMGKLCLAGVTTGIVDYTTYDDMKYAVSFLICKIFSCNYWFFLYLKLLFCNI